MAYWSWRGAIRSWSLFGARKPSLIFKDLPQIVCTHFSPSKYDGRKLFPDKLFRNQAYSKMNLEKQRYYNVATYHLRSLQIKGVFWKFNPSQKYFCVCLSCSSYKNIILCFINIKESIGQLIRSKESCNAAITIIKDFCLKQALFNIYSNHSYIFTCCYVGMLQSFRFHTVRTNQYILCYQKHSIALA